MRRGASLWRVVAVLLALSLVAAACGGDDDDGDDDALGAEEVVDPTGILRVGADLTQPTAGQIYPFPAIGAIDRLPENIFGTLLRLTPDGRSEPDLATSVEVVDPFTLVVTLRAGLTFTDGTVLDAAALKFSWENTLALSKGGEPEFREIASLTVTAPLVLRVTLKKPIAGTFVRLMRLYEASPVSPTAIKAGVDFNTAPVGAGPFKLESITAGQSVKLVKNPTYWDADNVKVAGLHYVNVTPAAMTNAVRSNAIDLAVLSAAEAREVAGSPGFEITVEPTNGIMLLGLLCKSRPPFDDLKVRQALNYGLDRDAINAVVYDGKGESAWGFNNAASPYFDASLKGRYDTDPVKAKQLLAEAGVPNLSFEMFYLPGAEGQSAAEIIQQQWDKIGVKVSLKPLANNADFFPNATGAPITIIPLNRVGIPKITRVLVPGNAGNVCNYDDPELNALVTSLQGVDETSPDGVALWKKISQNGITKAVHVFGLFGTRALAVDESRLGGVTFSENRLGQPTIDTRGVFVKKK